MKTLWRDVANYLGFPYSTPTKPSTSSGGTTMFQDTITDSDLEVMIKRNQAAHCIITDVAQDAVTTFQCLKADESEQPDFNTDVHTVYNKHIAKPLARALLHTRLYGHCGILIGYNTKDDLATKAKQNTKISYLQPIPKPWINEIALEKDTGGNLTLPVSVDHYKLVIRNNETIDGSKLVHMFNPNEDENTLNGESSLECVFDNLTILKSMDWGTGQSMWRSGGGLTVFIAPEGSNQAQLDSIHDVGEEINAKTALTMPPGTGVESARAININPKPSYEVIMQQISIGTRIPTSILMGSQSGTLTASQKDREDYYELLDNIQKNVVTPTLTTLLQKFQASGQLPEKEFVIKWDKTPIRLTEEARGELYLAQTELQKNIARRELAQAKIKEIEYKEYKERQKAQNAKEEEQMAQLPGIILEAPHAELIWRGIQKSIAKPVQLRHMNEPAYLLADRKCYGIIRLTDAASVTEAQFKARTPEHLVTDEEHKDIWGSTDESAIFIHSFTMDKMFSTPKACDYVQSRNYAKYVEFK